jgi:hypothetical protein
LRSPYGLWHFFSNAALSAQQDSPGKIWPTSAKFVGPKGETSLAIPLDVYFEYGNGTAKSKSDPNVVDIHRNRYTVGGDFITSWFWYWGANFQYTKTKDDGSAPFVPSIDTQKKLDGGSFYVAHYILPRVLAGVRLNYNSAGGQTIYNFADVNHEKSKYRGVRPFVRVYQPLTDALMFSYGMAIDFDWAKFNYDANIPPTAGTRDVIARFPVLLEYTMTPNLTIGGGAQLNRQWEMDTFPNVPYPDRTTVTLAAEASFNLNNAMTIYANIAHDVFDTVYDSTRFNIGLSIPLYGMLRRRTRQTTALAALK